MSLEVYAALAALAAEEHGLVMDGRYEELDALAERREPLLAALPEVPPIEALGYMRQALELQQLVTAQLIEAREKTGAQLRESNRIHAGARGYVVATGAAQAAVAATVNERG